MEAEFVRELDKLSSAESETAAFWQGKYAALEKQLVLTLQAQGEEAPYMRQEEKDEAEEAEWQRERENRTRMELELNELRGAWERTKEMLARRDEEVAQLRAQVRGLKEWVSTSTRTDGQAQTSDEVFGEGMAKLGNGLQNWVLVNFRRVKVGK
jgi:chromosome segregation ATPase